MDGTEPLKKLFLMLVVILSLCGGVMAVQATANGPWGQTDSVVYIATGYNLAHGLGLGYYEANAVFTPTTFYPPLTSLMLALIGLFDADLVEALRWVNILSFVVVIFLSGWIFLRYSSSPSAGLLAAALVCSFPGAVNMFSSSYSEPLLILLLMAGGACLLEYRRSGLSRFLVLGGILIGCAPLARYAGLALLGSAILWLFLFDAGKLKRRVSKSLIFALGASAPSITWFLWVSSVTQRSVGGRAIQINVSDLANQFQSFRALFMDTVWHWIPFQSIQTPLPYSLRFVLMGLVTINLIVLCWLATRRLRQVEGEAKETWGELHIFSLFGLLALFYLFFIGASYLFIVPTIDVDNRMLLPFFITTVISLFAGFALLQQTWMKGKTRWLRIIPWLAAALCVYWYLPPTWDQVQSLHTGYGLTANRWRFSETVNAVRNLPAEQAVISNHWEALMLWTNRPVHSLWNTFPADGLQKAPYGSNRGDLNQVLFCNQPSALVIFQDFPDQLHRRSHNLSPGAEKALFNGLTVLGTYQDGVIYYCK